jgi:hypothetical protein
VAPVCGLRPFRAFLCEIEKVPNPINATRSPLRNAPVILLTVVSIAVVACALLISHAPAILSTKSALFIVSPRRSLSCPAQYREVQTRLSGLGNLTGGILLSLGRMSTVKIRAGSLFRNSPSRSGPGRADFRSGGRIFPPVSTDSAGAAQDVHRARMFRTCGKPGSRCRVREQVDSDPEKFEDSC